MLKRKDAFEKSIEAVVPLGNIVSDLEKANESIDNEVSNAFMAIANAEDVIKEQQELRTKLTNQKSYNNKIISNLSGMLNLGGI